jgi:hypothetical protein
MTRAIETRGKTSEGTKAMKTEQAMIQQTNAARWEVCRPEAGTTVADGRFICVGQFHSERAAEKFCNARGYSVFCRCYIQFEKM